MLKNIGITINSNSYTPEAYAYQTYLSTLGFHVQLDTENNLSPYNDINIYFMGIRPFGKKTGTAIEVHEYQSLSTPPFATEKDNIKRIINRKPEGRIFLNDIVRNKLGFKDSVSYINRDMGVDDALFQKPSENPIYDIVYCGSINGRPGLIKEIIRLASIGFKILIIGNVSDDIKEILSVSKYKIHLVGPIERKYLPNLYRECRAGLNYTPDIYPFNIQTSTKTLEYLASGLSLISNKYKWIEAFSTLSGIYPIWVNDINDRNSIPTSKYMLSKKQYSWDNILRNAKFEDFLISLFER